MILVTGGLGFIGSHTARALVALGQDCIVTSHRNTVPPDILSGDVADHLHIEPLDVTDREALRTIGRRHPIDGIVHLADPAVARVMDTMINGTRPEFAALLTGSGAILDAAAEWGVGRITMVSTVGLYGGVGAGPWREDAPLPVSSAHGIPAMKKIAETLAKFAAASSGLPVVCVRPSGIWGPGGRKASRMFSIPSLVHAAVRPDPAVPTPTLVGDEGGDICYVRDCARAIALVQMTPSLGHDTYNIGGGRMTTNAEVVVAIARAVPGFCPPLTQAEPAVTQPGDQFMDVARLTADTAYMPAFSLDGAVQDYVAWLRDGHDR